MVEVERERERKVSAGGRRRRRRRRRFGGAKGKKKKARRKINPSLLSHLENRQGESPRLAAPGLRQADDVLACGYLKERKKGVRRERRRRRRRMETSSSRRRDANECLPLSFSVLSSSSNSPASRCGTAAAWISVGAVHPSAAAASASWSQTPRAVNLLTAAAVSAAVEDGALFEVERPLKPPPLVMMDTRVKGARPAGEGK